MSRWSVDPVHSSLSFEVRHLGLFHVKGIIKGVRGFAEFDPDAGRLSAEIEADIAGMDTGDPKRDAHLRAADFLDAEKHPTAVFRSTEALREDGSWDVRGDLTLRGLAKPVSVRMEYLGQTENEGVKRIGFRGTALVDRFAYGIAWDHKTDGGEHVASRDVILTIDLECVPA
jgi:polyisoprenoid-binding protein YceI